MGTAPPRARELAAQPAAQHDPNLPLRQGELAAAALLPIQPHTHPPVIQPQSAVHQ